MIRTWLARFFQLPDDADDLTRLRSRYIQAIAVVGIVVNLALSVVSVSSGSLDTTTLIYSIFTLGLVISLLLLVRLQRLGIASTSLIIVGSFFTIISSDLSYLLSGVFVIITAAALGSRLIYFLANFVIVASAVYDLWRQWTANPDALLFSTIQNKLFLMITLITVSVATRFFINQAEKSTHAAKANANLLQAVAETGEILAKLLNLTTLLPRAVELIQERFGFYHVQVFLLDETNEYASLAASTGATGQKLLERRHRLAVGSKSVIGQVTLTANPVIARDTDALYFRNELLPNTRAELALPIMDGDKMIGVLDVQSRRVDAFEAEAVQALQVMANLLGTSIRNARFFEQQDMSARETRRLFLESESNLREIQRLNQQLTKQGWENYLRNRRQINGVTLDQEKFVVDDHWSDTLVKASESRQPVTHSSNGTGVIAVPVMLGSEVIGAIEIESGSGRENENIEMVKAVAQRLALSLDKARLFEESQEATAQEQRINEIVALYQTVSNVDDLLQITLSELSDSLGAKRGAIRLGVGGNSSLNGESQA